MRRNHKNHIGSPCSLSLLYDMFLFLGLLTSRAGAYSLLSPKQGNFLSKYGNGHLETN